ncbi:MAG: type III-A CRISPR-associated protein Cas10/Csm1 [Cryomorphaceae bacterium]|nr:type III-A CRISPR-associated protein Cas10/Csm1 [Cryomorphaceae bacterium]
MTKNEIYLAALLHDIGKFWQRADPNGYEASSELSSTSKELARFICPQKDTGGYSFPTHLHVIWTHEFFAQHLSKPLSKLGLKVNPFFQEGKTQDNLINASIYHHRPETPLQGLIQMADHWASGIDRTQKETEAIEGRYFKNVPLLSIFSQLNGKDKRDFYTPMKAQNPADKNAVFPVIDENDALNYANLWESFVEEIELIPVADDPSPQALNSYLDTLHFVLKKYTSAIPASTFKKDIPCVCLYDHLRITAAIAHSLFIWSEEKSFENAFKVNDNNKLSLKTSEDLPLLLACVDLSGIQKFIYDIAGNKAAKSLKGRSFYLQLLIDSVLDSIISDNELHTGHVVYSSGGKAYILLPNTKKTKESISILHREISKALKAEQEENLYVCLDYVAFAYDNNYKIRFDWDGKIEETNNLGEVWRFLAEKTGRQKMRRYESLIYESFDEFFTPKQVDEKGKVCSVTGLNLLESDAIELSDDVMVSKSIYNQILLGQELKDADYLISFKGGKVPPSLKKSRHLQPLKLGVNKYLFDKRQLTRDNDEFRLITSFDQCRVQMINETSFSGINNLKGKLASYGYLFYGGNHQARNKDESEKTYEELAGNSNFQRLGVLRMDIDNLGDIFINRIPENQRNIATYATLSAQLDLFFSGYINSIRNSDTFKSWVNIIYSGGDDLFAVGRWDKIILFACEVRNRFVEFVGGRDDITLSGGIAMIGAKYPIAKGADEAGIAEAKAKQYIFQNANPFPTKNAINVFEINLQWSALEKALEMKEEFVSLHEKQLLSSGFFQMLMRYYLRRKQELTKSEKPNLSYVWNTAYFLKRYAQRNKNDEELHRMIEKLQTNIIENVSENSDYWDVLAVAARWAELELRMNASNVKSKTP